MIQRTFLVSDTHFGHKNIVKFTRRDGSMLRPWRTIEEHDQALIDNWNSVVLPTDRVFHLGDVSLCKAERFHDIMRCLNGHKILIKGNHDTLPIMAYVEHFEDVRAYHELGGYLLTHMPVEFDTLFPRWKGQLHGHTHANNSGDARYVNVSVEQTNFTPILFDKAVARFPKEQTWLR